MFPTDLPTVVLRCRLFGRPATLILVLPLAGSALMGAFWSWRHVFTEARIGRA
jgi:hypothetical protein